MVTVTINIVAQIATIYPVAATSTKNTVSFIAGIIRLLVNTGNTPFSGGYLINSPCSSGKYLLYAIIWHLPAFIRENTLQRIQTTIGINKIISSATIQ